MKKLIVALLLVMLFSVAGTALGSDALRGIGLRNWAFRVYGIESTGDSIIVSLPTRFSDTVTIEGILYLSFDASEYLVIQDATDTTRIYPDSAIFNTVDTGLVMDSDGNIGISDLNPGTLLQLKHASAYITLQNETAENTQDGAETRIIFEDHANAALAQIQGHHENTADDTKGGLALSTHTGSALTEAIRIDENQFVGFGTTAPGGLIHAVQTTVGSYGQLISRNIDEAGSYPLVEFENTHANNTQVTLLIDHDGTGGPDGNALKVDSENAAGPAVRIESAQVGLLLIDASPKWILTDTDINTQVDTEAEYADTAAVVAYTQGDGDGQIDIVAKDGDKISIYHSGSSAFFTQSVGDLYLGQDGTNTISQDDIHADADDTHDFGTAAIRWRDYYGANLVQVYDTDPEVIVADSDGEDGGTVDSSAVIHDVVNLDGRTRWFSDEGQVLSAYIDGAAAYIDASNGWLALDGESGIALQVTGATEWSVIGSMLYPPDDANDFGSITQRIKDAHFANLVQVFDTDPEVVIADSDGEDGTAVDSSAVIHDVNSLDGRTRWFSDEGATLSAYQDGNAHLVSSVGNFNVDGKTGLIFRINDTATWRISTTEFYPGTDSTENIGTTTIAPLHIYSKGNLYVSRETTIAGTDSSIFLDVNTGHGRLNFRANDADASDITMNTSDQMLFNNAVGGYVFDAAITATGIGLTGGITITMDDPFVYYDPSTASESEWWTGVNHDAGGADNDNFEIRQSATPGTNVELYIQPDGDAFITGDLTITGDDLFMNTNTTGYILRADNTNYNPVAFTASSHLAGFLSDEVGTDKAIFDTDPIFQTSVTARGATDASLAIVLEADQGADNPDTWQILIADGDELAIQAYAGGSYADALTVVGSTLATDFVGALTAASLITDGALQAQGAFTSLGIDDNADAIALTLDVTTEKANFTADVSIGDDLHISDLGVIDFDTGDLTITHSAELLTVAGGAFDVDGALTAGSVVSDADVTGATVASITAANLVDKSAIESVTGVWTFDNVNADSVYTDTLKVDGFAELDNAEIGGAYVYRAGGTDVPDADVADDITITNISQVADISASAAEINTPLDGASVTLTEFQELETIGATTVSANQWAALGGVAETLTSAELDYVDGVTSAIQTQLDARCLESVFGIAVSTGLTLDGTDLKASTGLQSLSGLTLTAGDLAVATGANAWNVLDAGATTTILVGGGAADPVWTTATGSGAPVRATSPTIATSLLVNGAGPNYGGADGGGDDDYAVTITGVTAAAGTMITFLANDDNTGACTLNLNAGGAVSIKDQKGDDPADSYIDANSVVVVIFDGTNYVLITPDANP